MKRVITLCGLCVLAMAGIAVSIAVWNAPTEYALTSNEMADVVGGLSCHYCGSNGDGCPAATTEGECVRPDCNGSKKTSCKESQDHCIKDETLQTCSDTSIACSSQYRVYSCSPTTGEDENGNPVEECTWGSGTLHDCGDHKTGC